MFTAGRFRITMDKTARRYGMASLGKRIGEFRRRKDVTQERLAELMNVTAQAVSKWENDICCPDISLLPKLADYFGVSLDLLLRGEAAGTVRMQESKDICDKVLRITVAPPGGGNEVKLNLPLPLVKSGGGVGAGVIRIVKDGEGKDGKSFAQAIEGIDFNEVVRLAQSGTVGNFMEIKTKEGDAVSMTIE